MTGDRGYIIMVDGEKWAKYDRGPQGPQLPYRESDWIEIESNTPMSLMQLAEIAYLTCNRYWYYAQNHAKARRKWDTLREEERIHWMKNGPQDETARKFYLAVMTAGKDLAR